MSLSDQNRSRSSADRIANHESMLVSALHEAAPAIYVAFAAACCERLIPAYAYFSRVAERGDTATLRAALDAIWEHLSGAQPGTISFSTHAELCAACVPSHDGTTPILTSLAEIAGNCVLYTVESCDSFNPNVSVIASRSVIEAIDLYLWAAANPFPDASSLRGLFADAAPDERARRHRRVQTSLQDWIIESPLLRSELQEQLADVRRLRAHASLGRETLQALRSSASHRGLQLERRGLFPSRGKSGIGGVGVAG